LNHRRRNPGGKLLDRGIKLLQDWRGFCRQGSHQFRFVDVRLRRSTTSDGRDLRRYLLAETWRCKPQDAKARSKAKEREVQVPFRTASWAEHSDTLLWHTSVVLRQMVTTPDME
jgi:hypothetical protein